MKLRLTLKIEDLDAPENERVVCDTHQYDLPLDDSTLRDAKALPPVDRALLLAELVGSGLRDALRAHDVGILGTINAYIGKRNAVPPGPTGS